MYAFKRIHDYAKYVHDNRHSSSSYTLHKENRTMKRAILNGSFLVSTRFFLVITREKIFIMWAYSYVKQ